MFDQDSPGRSRRRANGGKARRRHALCDATGKRRFRDHHDAGLELRRQTRARSSIEAAGGEHTIRVVRTYKCDECRGWHLTSWAKPPQPVTTLPQRRPAPILPSGLVPEPFRAPAHRPAVA